MDLGMTDLPRRVGKVWAAEILRVNYCFSLINAVDESVVPGGRVDYQWVVGISTSNSSTITTYLGASPGEPKLWLVDQIFDTTNFSMQQAFGTAVGFTSQTRVGNMTVEHDLTDQSGRGILVFANNLYTLTATRGNTDGSTNLHVVPEIWFRYVEVPLEYYLSVQQDAAASGI